MDSDSFKTAFDSMFPDDESQDALFKLDTLRYEFLENQSATVTEGVGAVPADDPCLLDSHSFPTQVGDCFQYYLSASDLDFELSRLELEDELQNWPGNYVAKILPNDSVDKKQVEVVDTEDSEETQDFDTAIVQGIYLPPPPEMAERPSTISKMKDNVNFDISEFFDLDAATESEDQSEPQTFGDPVITGHLSDRMSSSGTSESIYSSSVDFLEYLKQSQSTTLLRNFKANALADARGQQIQPVTASRENTGAHRSVSSTTNHKGNVSNAFKAGAKDSFLPAMSDSLYDEEFAAFAAAGINSDSRSSQEVQSEICTPSSIANDDVAYKRAGEIYVSYLIRRKIELSGKFTEVPQEYAIEEIKWAMNYLSDEVKVWLRNNCGVDANESDWLTTIMEDDVQTLQRAQNAFGQSKSTQLPNVHNATHTDGKTQGLKYPERMRLFSEELGHSFPHTSNLLEEFEDVPQIPNQFSTGRSSETLSNANRIPPLSVASTNPERVSTFRFSFTNKDSYAIATQKLEALLMDTVHPTMQNLRMWPSLSFIPSQSEEMFMFKVTAPNNVDLVSILREVFPNMAVQTLGKNAVFLEKTVKTPNAQGLSCFTPNNTDTTELMAAKGKYRKQAETPVAKQPRRSSNPSTCLPDSASQMTVKTRADDGFAASNKLQRRRSSSRLSELRARLENSGPPEKKRRKKSN